MSDSEAQSEIDAIRQDFIAQWGALGSQWGINRTIAMIHAHLLLADEPQTTDQVMQSLKVSRGNANTNLRELVSWGLVRQVVVPGERKDHFEAEKDVWKIFCIVARERKRRETEPASQVLQSCIERSRRLRSQPAQRMRQQLEALSDFVSLANSLMEKIATKEKSVVLPKLLKLLS